MLEYGKYYHIYNRGINSQKIFRNKEDYLHFLKLTDIYITPIAEIYAYALMGNHFHIIIRIKDENEIGFLDSRNSKTDDLEKKWKTYFPNKDSGQKFNKRFNTVDNNFKAKPVPTKMFQHLFNAYAKGFNKKYSRTGSLLEYKFKRIVIETEIYLKRLILYVHNNPVKHRICEDIIEYPWTSYLSLVSIKPTKLSRETVLGYFDSMANFKFLHNKEDDISDIENLLLE